MRASTRWPASVREAPAPGAGGELLERDLEAAPGSLRGPSEIPIGPLYASVDLADGGAISRARFLCDWIAGSADVEQLESSLIGLRPEQVAAAIRPWFQHPERLAIGLTSPEPLIQLIRGSIDPQIC